MLTSLMYSAESWTGEVSVIQRGVRKMMNNDLHYNYVYMCCCVFSFLHAPEKLKFSLESSCVGKPEFKLIAACCHIFWSLFHCSRLEVHRLILGCPEPVGRNHSVYMETMNAFISSVLYTP